ncbi:MAG TPA: hypothetical protein HA264_07565 [Methanolinea sp.]|jgi:hypothetical protein|nr:hypothetical protein [Methanolinea sp.]HNQ29094.1 hypothetical protein [Methanolinea sp.]
MNRAELLLFFIAVMVVFLPVSAVEQQTAAAQVMVTNVTLDPQVFMVDDTGTVTVEVINNGAQSVAISRVTMYDEKIRIESRAYDTTMYLGAGNRMTFTFTVTTTVPDGIYYPVFSMDFRDAGYLRYPVKLQVQDKPLKVSILSKPDVFTSGKKEQVEVLIGNPRDNGVSGVIVYPMGEGIEASPSSIFIGMIAPDQSQKVTFSITPHQTTILEIHVDYMNGINPHAEVIQFPIGIGKSKTRADPILSNIQVEKSGKTYSITGDVNNAGLEVANAVVISTGDSVVPVDPYRKYVVGTLQPDDFSAFEVTFTAEGTDKVPVEVSYKDNDGNLYTTMTIIDIPVTKPGAQETEGMPLMMIAVILVCAAVIGGIVWFSWRKR